MSFGIFYALRPSFFPVKHLLSRRLGACPRASIAPWLRPVEVILIGIRYITHLKPTLVGTQLVKKTIEPHAWSFSIHIRVVAGRQVPLDMERPIPVLPARNQVSALNITQPVNFWIIRSIGTSLAIQSVNLLMRCGT